MNSACPPPYAPEWFRSVVRAVLKRFEVNIAVEQSSLSDRPAY